MCSLGRFIRETDTGVVPVFAWREWTLSGMLPGGPPVIGASGGPKTTGPALTSILSWLGYTPRSTRPASVPLRIAGPPDGEAVGILQSLNGTTWAPNQAFRAECGVRGAHATIPNRDCSCGVYAFRWRGDMATESCAGIPGIVALWGTVLEYESGYRAEMAYPAALILSGHLDGAERESLEKCARLYRVPVLGTPDEHRWDALVLALR
jgi:hypothetical protein